MYIGHLKIRVCLCYKSLSTKLLELSLEFIALDSAKEREVNFVCQDVGVAGWPLM